MHIGGVDVVALYNMSCPYGLPIDAQLQEHAPPGLGSAAFVCEKGKLASSLKKKSARGVELSRAKAESSKKRGRKL